MFFECSLFLIFVILSALRLYFGSYFLFGSPGPLKKQLKVCNHHPLQRFEPLQIEFFTGLDCGCVLIVFLLLIVVILGRVFEILGILEGILWILNRICMMLERLWKILKRLSKALKRL